MNNDLIATLIILLLACALLVWYSVSSEGFTSEGLDGDRCGVNMAPCANGTRCINGYCAKPNTPVLPAFSDLPVKPSDINDPGSFLHTE